ALVQERSLRLTLGSSFKPGLNDLVQAQAEEFGRQHNARMSVEFATVQDLPTKAATAAEAGAGPDVMALVSAGPYLLAEELVDVSDVVAAITAAEGDLHEIATPSARVGDVWKAVPHLFQPNMIAYRRDLFEQVGAAAQPATWEELASVGAQFRAQELPPIGFALGHAVNDANIFVYSVLWAYGASDVGEDGTTVTINSPETVAAIEYMQSLYESAMDSSVLSWDDASNNQAFLAGQLAATNNTPTIYAAAAERAPEVREQTSHFLFPEGPAGRKIFLAADTQGIFRYSTEQELAKEYLKYVHAEAQLRPYLADGEAVLMPYLRKYDDDPEMPWNTDPNLAAAVDVAENSQVLGYPGPPTRAAAEAINRFIVIDMFARATQGESPQEAIAWAEEQLNQIYGA
ncbi:MAG: ABC transporter substrate-binding protein, partial [Chloroflexota bacterium]